MPRFTAPCSSLGLADDRAAHCARLFAETTRDGVYTHGLNRFPRFAESVANGSVDVNAEPTKTAGFGAIERWDGHRGVGNLNASVSMQRAIALAKQYGIGGVALGNTNHWMRGGSYGLQAAEQGTLRHLLDEHSGQSAGVGSDDADHRQQSAYHRDSPPRRPRRAGHGDVAVLLRDARCLQQTRPASAGRRRLRLWRAI